MNVAATRIENLEASCTELADSSALPSSCEGIQQQLFASGHFGSHSAWLDWLTAMLPRPNLPHDAPKCIDLFAGCGGLALGFEVAGFATHGFEMKSDAVRTYNHNLHGRCDESFLTVGSPDETADIIIGGPPCQPFSQIGYQQGKRDPRDGFPVFLDAVNRIRPKIAIVENVRGLIFRNKEYLRQVVFELERFGYIVYVELVNAAWYGAPQNRQRVVIVATQVGWDWPKPIVDQPVTVGVALGPSALEEAEGARILTAKVDKYIAEYEARSQCVNPRDLHLDRPSRTVTCRNLHAMTADMLRLRLKDGRRRMLTMPEARRLQSFPEWFEFQGTKLEQLEQIGNSVAPLMALALGKQAMRQLTGAFMATKPSKSSIVTSRSISLKAETPRERKLREGLAILRDLGVRLGDFTEGRQTRLVMALLSAGRMRFEDPWDAAKSYKTHGNDCLPLRTKEFYSYWNENFGTSYALGGYDDVKRLDIDELMPYGLLEMQVIPAVSKRGLTASDASAQSKATYNAGSRGYTLTASAVQLLHAVETDQWMAQLARHRANHDLAGDRLSKHPDLASAPIELPDGTLLSLSSTYHNDIQRAIVQAFLPRFAPGAEILYIANTGTKKEQNKGSRYIEPTQQVFKHDVLSSIGVDLNEKKKLPDVILFDRARNWLFLIEAVHSKNPIHHTRHQALAEISSGSSAGRVYVTAFLDRASFAKFSRAISWKTEAWIASEPEHLIHFDGERFLGPYES